MANINIEYLLICGHFNFLEIDREHHYIEGGVESEQS